MIGCAAEMYGNQDEIGRALDKLFSEGVVKRQDLWVTSKACTPSLLTLPCSLHDWAAALHVRCAQLLGW